MRRGSRKSIKGSWGCKISIRIERLVVLRCNAIHTSVSGHVADEDSLVVHDVLSHTLVGPVVDEILEFDIIWPVIRVGNQNRHLGMINQVSILFDLRESVVESSCL